MRAKSVLRSATKATAHIEDGSHQGIQRLKSCFVPTPGKRPSWNQKGVRMVHRTSGAASRLKSKRPNQQGCSGTQQLWERPRQPERLELCMKSTADSKIKNGEPCKPRVWPLIQGGSLPGGQDLIYIQEAFYFLSVMGRSTDIFFRALKGLP